jgi:hypothetical protein
MNQFTVTEGDEQTIVTILPGVDNARIKIGPFAVLSPFFSFEKVLTFPTESDIIFAPTTNKKIN